jgi:thiamine transporter
MTSLARPAVFLCGLAWGKRDCQFRIREFFTMNRSRIRLVCEAAALLALAQILSYIKLYEFQNGGSVDCAMLPIILFAVRHGPGWGLGVGFVYGAMQYFFANGISIDWTTILCDYFLAYALLGLGAGLFRGRQYGVYWGTLGGGLLRFLAHWTVGAIVWGKYMPPVFFNLTMTNPWFYSFLYNASYMIPDTAICLVLFVLLYRPLKKYVTGADLRQIPAAQY